MMTLQDVHEMRRSEQAFLNVASYCSIYPASVITRVLVEELENVYCVRIFYVNNRTGKQFIHSFNFYRLAESREAENFIQLLTDNFGDISITGNHFV